MQSSMGTLERQRGIVRSGRDRGEASSGVSGNRKRPWTAEERASLAEKAAALRSRLRRALRPQDLKKIRLAGRSFHAIKSQAARLGLLTPSRVAKRWTEREVQVLRVLAKSRGLGARSIKQRGFFCAEEGSVESWRSRSIDSIAQMKRRLHLVDEKRSRRARYANRLSKDTRKRLRDELKQNPRQWTTEEFAEEYGVSPSTIRRYRKIWKIPHSWHLARKLPKSAARLETLAERTRERNIERWKSRKNELRRDLERRRRRVLAAAEKKGRPALLRQCVHCGEKWPLTPVFFARTHKRRGGKVVAEYLRRTCRICPRRPRTEKPPINGVERTEEE
jgi:hypothetical protein